MTFMTRYYYNFRNSRRFNSVFPHTFNLILFLLLVLLYTSCQTGPTKIGNGLLPSTDFVDIQSIDTLKAISYSALNDSVRTDNPSICYLGQIFDPYFGTTTASFVTQLRLSAKWDSTVSIRIDSFKLFLELLNVKKSSSDGLHSIRISAIANQIYTDVSYYSNSPVPLTDSTWTIPLPALKADTINELRIKIPNRIARFLLRDSTKLFYNNAVPDFRAYFKGFYFQMEPQNDALFTYLSSIPTPNRGYYNNAFVMYYTDLTTNTPLQYLFVIDANNKNAAFNKFTHDFSTATKGDKMVHVNTTYKDIFSYLQYLDGVYTRITIPGLEALKKELTASQTKFAVNKAKLTVPIYWDSTIYKKSDLPSKLRLRYRTKSGLKYEVPDYGIETTYHTFFDGSLDTAAMIYNFNIPTYVQGYLKDATGELEPVLELFQTFDATSPKNVIFKANNNSKTIKFQFTYTKF